MKKITKCASFERQLLLFCVQLKVLGTCTSSQYTRGISDTFEYYEILLYSKDGKSSTFRYIGMYHTYHSSNYGAKKSFSNDYSQ